MAGDRERSAGEAAKAKVERREGVEEAGERAVEGTDTGPDSGRSSEELRADVERAREELADTVTALGQKVDPRPKVEHAAESARSNAVPIGAAIAIALLALILWKRR